MYKHTAVICMTLSQESYGALGLGPNQPRAVQQRAGGDKKSVIQGHVSPRICSLQWKFLPPTVFSRSASILLLFPLAEHGRPVTVMNFIYFTKVKGFLPFRFPPWDLKALAIMDLQSTDNVPRLHMCLPCFILHVSSDQLEGSLVLACRWLHCLHLYSHHPNSEHIWGLARVVENECWDLGGLGQSVAPPEGMGMLSCTGVCGRKRLTISKSLSCLTARVVWQVSVVGKAFGGFSDLCFPCHHHWFKKT